MHSEPDWQPGSVEAQREKHMEGSNHIDPGDPPEEHTTLMISTSNGDGVLYATDTNPGTIFRDVAGRLWKSLNSPMGMVFMRIPDSQVSIEPAYQKRQTIKPAPNYEADTAAEPDETQMLWLNIGIPAELVPDHTQRILQEIVPDVLRLWIRRNVEYGDEAKELGAKGQYADINRKVRKLKRLLWDDNVPAWAVSEDKEQVLMDLVGHCLLTIDLLRKDNIHGA